MSILDTYLIQSGVSDGDIVDCLRWAFGDDYNSLQVRRLAQRWRERHGDLFIVNDSDSISRVMHKIGEAFCERGEPVH